MAGAGWKRQKAGVLTDGCVADDVAFLLMGFSPAWDAPADGEPSQAAGRDSRSRGKGTALVRVSADWLRAGRAGPGNRPGDGADLRKT